MTLSLFYAAEISADYLFVAFSDLYFILFATLFQYNINILGPNP